MDLKTGPVSLNKCMDILNRNKNKPMEDEWEKAYLYENKDASYLQKLHGDLKAAIENIKNISDNNNANFQEEKKEVENNNNNEIGEVIDLTKELSKLSTDEIEAGKHINIIPQSKDELKNLNDDDLKDLIMQLVNIIHKMEQQIIAYEDKENNGREIN